MTLTQLNYIIALDRCRNFAQAAKECFVTQPTLSMQIQKLEDYLQIIIFDRSKSPVEPTPIGNSVLKYARVIMSGAVELEELSKSLRGEVSGEYILAIIPTLASSILPLFISRFSEQFPEVELKIYEQETHKIIKNLKDGKVDGAILAVPLDEKELKETHLFYEPFKIFLSPEHKLLKKKQIDETELQINEAWLLKEGHCLRNQALELCKFKNEDAMRKLKFEAGSLETLINIVKTSTGFTILPYLATKFLSHKDLNLVRNFKKYIPVRNVAFVTGPHSLKRSIDMALVEVITSNIPKELKNFSKLNEVIPICNR